MEGSISKRGRRALATVGVLAAGLAVAAPSALAGEASVVGSEVRYDAYFGEPNDVTLRQLPPVNGKTSIIIDDSVKIDDGGECSHPTLDLSVVECRVANPQLVRVWLGNGDDHLQPAAGTVFNTPLSVEGQPGDDVITGGDRADVIDGQDGVDTVHGGNGDDDVYGGSNDDKLFGDAGGDLLDGQLGGDKLNGGSGPDVMRGGDGADTLNADDQAGGDNLNCGTGPFATDLAIFNDADVVSTNCDLLQPA